MARETRWMIVKEGRRRLGEKGMGRWHERQDRGEKKEEMEREGTEYYRRRKLRQDG